MQSGDIKVLVACEESQAVCNAFRECGFEAYSCDIQGCSGGHPEWHICGDALKAMMGGQIVTQDGKARSKTFPGIAKAMVRLFTKYK